MTTSPGWTRSWPRIVVLFDHAHTVGGQVVLVGAHHARVLRGLAAEQGAAGVAAAVGDARADLGDAVRHHLTAGDVVEQEQRLRAARDQVVDDHRDQVDADRVVDVHLLGDHQLGADAVGRGREHRLLVLLDVEAEQAGEAAEPAQHLGPVGPLHLVLQQLHRLVPGVDGHPGIGVGDASFAAVAVHS